MKSGLERRSLMLRLVKDTFPLYKGKYALALVFMLLAAAMTSCFGLIIKPMINGIFGEKSMSLAYLICLAIIAIFIVKGFSVYFYAVILSRIGNNMTAVAQKRMFDALMSQGLEYHAKFNTADSLTRILRNAVSVRDMMQLIVVSLGKDLTTVIGLTIAMVYQDPLLSLVALITMPLAVFGVNSLRKRIKKLALLETNSQSRMTNLLQESLQGIKVVKSFNLHDERKRALNVAITDLEKRNSKIQQLSSLTQPLMETIGGVMIALVVIYGAWRVIHGGSDPGSFFSFLISLLLAYEPAKRLARTQVHMEQHMAGVNMMYELIDARSIIQDAVNAEHLKITRGEIKFTDVSFAYNDEKVLNSLSFTFKPRTTTALIGGSGAGKSTILNLINRFYDPSYGVISIDNQDIKAVTLKSLNANIAYVSQDNFLFQGTIKENIRFGRLDASDEEIIEAAKNAYAHDFILEQPLGYETALGEFGAGLSGGQKQRIAIARAFLKNAPILLLDEATSALDSASEAEIQRALLRLTENRTTLIVAHRLSTIAHADKIIVMEKGEVVEEGAPADLIQKGGHYANLLAFQVIN